MKRLVLLLGILAVAKPSFALPVGGPGFALDQDDRKFAVTGGLGYTYRPVEGENFAGEDRKDYQSSFRFLMRAEAAVLPWFTPGVYLGYGDRSRSLTAFEGTLGPIFGFAARLDPLIQKHDSGIGIAVIPQFSYENSVGRGKVTRRNRFGDKTVAEESETATTWHYETTALLSRKEGRVGLYAGPKFDYDRSVYTSRHETVTPILSFGVVVGVDYDITPQVFFSAEMDNFHQDALHVLVGGRF
jgi:hypothetical protein